MVMEILVGIVVGVLSGFGIGGGTILMVWLTAIAAVEQRTAQGINLLYYIPTALAAAFFHAKHKFIVWKAVLPAAICGCITAGLAAYVGTHMDVGLLRKLFGGFLLLVGVWELTHKRD